jgi:hypothetical protein
MDGPRLYLNGFPKSGLHLLWTWALPFVKEAAIMPPWAGTFQGNAWTTAWSENGSLFERLDCLQPGTFLKGHCGWRQDIEDYMQENGIVHVFVFRDPRDVAVSQAHHILGANERTGEIGKILFHPGADAIKEATGGDFDAVLSACIAGMDEWEGVIKRWELYAGWLDVPWVLSLKFEDMREKAFEMAQLMIRYVYGRAARAAGFKMGLYQEDLDSATRHLLHVADEARKYSPTYRKGTSGGWREAFTDEHIELWKEHDPTGWVERLGYEW